MPRKKKVNEEQILAVVLNILDESGVKELTIQNVAKKLDIKAPSLYNHISGFNQIQESVTSFVLEEMNSQISMAIKDKTKKNILSDLAMEYRAYVLKHPGRYQFSVAYPADAESKWQNSFILFRETFASAIRENFNLPEALVRSSARSLRSFMHGHLMFELIGGWSAIIDAEESYSEGVQIIIAGMESLEKKEV